MPFTTATIILRLASESFLKDGAALHWTPVEVRRVFDSPADSLFITPAKGAEPVPTPLSDHYGFMADVELGP